MISSTLKFTVVADNYEEVIEETKSVISSFFEIPSEDVEKKFNIEIEVTNDLSQVDLDSHSDEEYVAKVIAKVRNV